MKSKLLILSLFAWTNAFAQSVPNTDTFTLQNVVDSIGGTSLTEAFTNAVDAYFDPTYKGSKDRLSNFRNYTVSGCVLPTFVSLTNAYNVTSTSFMSGGNISADGGCTITQRGVVASTTSPPTLADFSANSGTGTGTYTVTITGLSPNTTYYYRMYAINSVGTKYGSTILTFVTSP